MAIGGGTAQEGGHRPQPLRLWAAGGFVVLIGALLPAFLVEGTVARFVAATIAICGGLTFSVAVLAAVVRREVRRYAQLVSHSAEHLLTDVLPPARVVGLVLDKVYGASPRNREVVTTLLGGVGDRADGSGLTISSRTTIELDLERLGETSYRLSMQASYAFRRQISTSSVLIFVTSDPVLRDSIIEGCRRPLFELWYIREDDSGPSFGESVSRMQESLRVGMQYTDEVGNDQMLVAVDPAPALVDVGVTEWGRYLTLFSEEDHSPRFRRGDFINKLRVLDIDLHRLVPGASPRTVTSFTVRSSTTQKIADGFCFWQAPYPCYVDSIRFDTKGLDLPDGSELLFWTKSFTAATQTAIPRWTTNDGPQSVELDSWMLRGHGVTLNWRPARDMLGA